MSRKSLPTHKAIIDHWMPIINKSNKYTSFSIDWGEPTCWACGRYWNGNYDIRTDFDMGTESGMKKVYAAWKKSPVQRAHILADSLGGSSHPSNIFFLCKHCHEKSPDTTNTEIFFRWCITQDWRTQAEIEIKENLKIYGYDIENERDALYLSNVFTVFNNAAGESKKKGKNPSGDYKEILKYMDKNVARHFSGFSNSTMLYCLLLYAGAIREEAIV